MGKVVFNIVETDYDVSKDEEKYQKFRKDYLENLSVGVCRLQEQYGLTSYRREKFINRIRCEDHVRRRSNGRFYCFRKGGIMNNEEIDKLTVKIESCWDENNPGDVRSFDERLKQKLTPEEYELITSWR